MNKTWRRPRCCRYRMIRPYIWSGLAPPLPLPAHPPLTRGPVLRLPDDRTLYIWWGPAWPPPPPYSLLSSPGAKCLSYRMISLYIWPGLAPPMALNPPHIMNFIYFILTDSQCFLLLLCFLKPRGYCWLVSRTPLLKARSHCEHAIATDSRIGNVQVTFLGH